MGPSDIKLNILLKTIEKMPAEFYTKEVSNHPDMISAHSEEIKHSHYHSFVGKAIKRLSNQQLKGKLIEDSKGSTKGSLWRKVSSQLIAVTDIKYKEGNEKTLFFVKPWVKAVITVILITVVIIVAAIVALAWIFLLILTVSALIFGPLIRDILRESKKKYN